QGNAEHGPPGGRGAARHSLVLLDFRRERPTQRSGVGRALETKFLRFWTGQERDGVPSLPPSPGSFRPGVGFGRPEAAVLRRRWRGAVRLRCEASAASCRATGRVPEPAAPPLACWLGGRQYTGARDAGEAPGNGVTFMASSEGSHKRLLLPDVPKWSVSTLGDIFGMLQPNGHLRGLLGLHLQ